MTTDNNYAADDIDVLTEDDTRPWAVGDEVTVLAAGITVPWGAPGGGNYVCARGDVLTVTHDTVTHRADFLSLVADPEAQAERWGTQKLQRGRIEVERWSERGDRIWLDERAAARDLAHAIIDPAERAAALAEVHRRFGPLATSTSTPTRNLGQRRALAEDAARRATQRREIITSHTD